MMLLSAPFDPCPADRAEPLGRRGILAITITLVAVAVGLAIQMQGGTIRALGRGMTSGAVHSGFLLIGWVIAGRSPSRLVAVIQSAAALLLASVASPFTAWGVLLYLLPPVFLFGGGIARSAGRTMCRDMTAGLRHLAVGLAAGTFLGVHLLISASLTLGYAVRVLGLGQYLAAVAYDLGANALTAEWLFRGAVFATWWQRWEFWPAASLSTVLVMARYLVDPALPQTVEVRAGTVFYIALLGLSACALRAWSGSLVPGYLATVVFFAFYRMLAVGGSG